MAKTKKQKLAVTAPEEQYQQAIKKVREQAKSKKPPKVKQPVVDLEPKPRSEKRFFLLVAVCLAVIFIFWLGVLRHNITNSLSQPSAADMSIEQEWEKIKGEMSASMAKLKKDSAQLAVTLNQQTAETNNSNQPILNAEELKKFKANLLLEATKSWPVYKSQGYNFSFKYPVSWQVTKERTATGAELVTINSPTGGESINIVVAAVLPLPEWSAVKLSDSDWAGEKAALYQTGQDQNIRNYLVADLPGSSKAIAISAVGASSDFLSQVLLTFKWSK